MNENKLHKLESYSTAEGLDLALSYLEDPSDIACPRCGTGRVEVMAYLEPDRLHSGVMVRARPEGNYTVVLYCHGCGCAAALDFSPAGTREDAA